MSSYDLRPGEMQLQGQRASDGVYVDIGEPSTTPQPFEPDVAFRAYRYRMCPKPGVHEFTVPTMVVRVTQERLPEIE